MFSFNAPGNSNDTKLYDSLNLSKTCNEDEIKKAYKKLALKYHPDRNLNNKEEAEAKFKEVSSAYEILSNPKKREMYDKYGMDAIKNMNDGPGVNPFDIFGQLFGGSPFGGSPFGGPQFGNRNVRTRARDRVENIDVSLEDIYTCKSIKINLKKNVICSDCSGRGGINKTSVTKCDACHGSGTIMSIRQIGPGMIQQSSQECHRCKGRGKSIAPGQECNACHGKRTVIKQKSIDICLENGAKTGDKIIKHEEGHQNPDADEQGDLILILNEKKHPVLNEMVII